ncbi:MBL fold metallo-hydrolase [Photobacterium sp. CCB-ST2H9]|uniref:MBL fold metallo-hydrolase n=1 Tax=Photobacterium sp. CCB-ST2H9 TaxID=2912855 RepID=UPI0020062898|nr:MBL fold metallo-hydrolase [Photobacterium sp. CCB-ST2H9]UTM59290.1 MBL fold metallo-hydrolase [Photobacterium sp. CCB-ST2H9]
MKFTQVRNATLIIDFAGKKFLIDPMLAKKGTYPGFEGTPNNHLRNPLVDLPFSLETLLDVDAVIVTHTHPDHWDEVAKQVIPKDLLFFAQHEQDAAIIQQSGFTNIRVLSEHTDYDGITLSITGGQHGSDDVMAVIGERMGEVSGVVFSHPDEQTLYIAGDTVWNAHVHASISQFQPDVIVLNSGDAQVIGLGPIIMNKEDVRSVYEAAPNATIIASHMEAVNHAVLSRPMLRDYLTEFSMTDRTLVPEDGESYTFA